jgi:putative endonuclease
MNHNYYLYITTNPGKSVIYIGVTNDIKRRLTEHFNARGNCLSFVSRYYCYNLIYYEHFSDINQEIEREKQIKNMNREKKKELITCMNPNWKFIRI